MKSRREVVQLHQEKLAQEEEELLQAKVQVDLAVAARDRALAAVKSRKSAIAALTSGLTIQEQTATVKPGEFNSMPLAAATIAYLKHRGIYSANLKTEVCEALAKGGAVTSKRIPFEEIKPIVRFRALVIAVSSSSELSYDDKTNEVKLVH